MLPLSHDGNSSSIIIWKGPSCQFPGPQSELSGLLGQRYDCTFGGCPVCQMAEETDTGAPGGCSATWRELGVEGGLWSSLAAVGHEFLANVPPLTGRIYSQASTSLNPPPRRQQDRLHKKPGAESGPRQRLGWRGLGRCEPARCSKGRSQLLPSPPGRV